MTNKCMGCGTYTYEQTFCSGSCRYYVTGDKTGLSELQLLIGKIKQEKWGG